MITIPLKYGCNPNQKTAQLTFTTDPPPLRVVNGQPGYVNMLDAVRAWQLVRELAIAAGKPAAASFKHVSPAGAAVAGELPAAFCKAHFIADPRKLSPLATAYAKARSSDRVASFGDFIAVSEPVDETLAAIIKPEVSDGIIAPGYEPAALEILKQKKKGGYVIVQMDRDYEPSADLLDSRSDFGITLKQLRNTSVIDAKLFTNIVTRNKGIADLPGVVESLIVATVTLKHTQSNSIAVGYAGQAIGVARASSHALPARDWPATKPIAGCSRCTPRPWRCNTRPCRARRRSTRWISSCATTSWMTTSAELAAKLTAPPVPINREEREDWVRSFRGVVLSSDAFFPFRDNIDRAARSGVKAIAQAGGSARDADVIAAADEHGMVMAMTGLRLFLH